MTGTRLGAIVVLISVAVLLIGSGQAWSGRVLPGRTISQEEVLKEVERYKALGGEYKPQGFPYLEKGTTPFAQWRRIETSRLKGREVYVSLEEIRIWKTMFCGRETEIYLELSLMDRAGNLVPFAWQQCGLVCEYSGSCELDNPVFIDITGNGMPEIRLPELGKLVKVARSWFKNTRYNFQVDILPAWLRDVLGPNLKKTSTIGPGDSVPNWKDHPVRLEEVTEGKL